MNNKKKLNLEYGIGADQCWNRCYLLIKNATEFKHFMYAALELRLCIERLCLEYLVLFTLGKRELSQNELKLYQPKKILEKVKKEEPELKKKIHFFNATNPFKGKVVKMTMPNINRLIKAHGRIGNLLHLRVKDFTESEKESLIDFVMDEHEYLKSCILGRGNINNLASHAEMILRKYVADEINKEAMERMVDISTLPYYLYDKRPPDHPLYN